MTCAVLLKSTSEAGGQPAAVGLPVGLPVVKGFGVGPGGPNKSYSSCSVVAGTGMSCADPAGLPAGLRHLDRLHRRGRHGKASCLVTRWNTGLKRELKGLRVKRSKKEGWV